MRPCRVVLSRAALRQNYDRLKAIAPASHFWAVIKANAYGHGLLFAAQALSDRADGFAVASLEEAERLRQVGIMQPILLLEGLFSEDEVALARALDVALVVHRSEQLRWLSAEADHPWSVWLKLDTGMHRLGFDWRESRSVLQQTKRLLPNARLHVLSHLACADEAEEDFTVIQRQRFEQAVADWPMPRSLANSAALIRYPETHYDWVRPGIALYGATDLLPTLKPVMRFVSEVIAVREVEVGEGVGYGLSWRASRPSRLAIVAAGYGDGYPRHAPSGTPVWLAGHEAPLVGRVSMDMLCVDITEHPAADTVGPGTGVELWGEQVSVVEVAKRSGTIAYELLCGIAERVNREEED